MNTTAVKKKSTPAAPPIPLPKIIVVKKELTHMGWNQHLPVPLVADEKVIVVSDQTGVQKGYVKVKHGKSAVSTFSRHHFLTLGGREVSQCS